MKKVLIGTVLAVLPVGAIAEGGNWGYYEPGDGTMQAGIAGSNGSQLIFKCDRAGKRRVYAVIVSPTALAAAKGASGYESRDVTLRFDDRPPIEDQWRFNDKFAMAMDDRNLRAMTRFGGNLADAQKLDVILKPFQKAPVQLSFDVAGARPALERIYEACKDEMLFN